MSVSRRISPVLPGPAVAFSLCLVVAASLVSAAPNVPTDVRPDTVPDPTLREDEGVGIRLKLDPVHGDSQAPLYEGDAVKVSFAISDTATETPLRGLYPAAWMDLLPSSKEGATSAEDCLEKVSTFLGGSLFAQPELNLNVYYVLALNDDATITVVDPLFGFGTTKLLELVVLPAKGEDWVLDAPRRRIFVSMPTLGKVAVVDTESWKITRQIDTASRPERLALLADGRYLWAADDGSSENSGVTVIDTEPLEVVAQIPTGAGQHDLTVSPDDRFAFVTNYLAGTVSVISTWDLVKTQTLATGSRPLSIDFSAMGGAAYVADQADGTITVIDGESHRIVARMEAAAGLNQIRFAPGGRYGLAPNPDNNRVYVIDAAAQRIVQNGEMEKGPDQITFTDELAYVRHRDSELILMIPLVSIGGEGEPIAVVDFPGGQRPPGLGAKPSRADSIVQAPGSPAVLVANPGDKTIYFYKEGMAAPMGNFQNYNRQPRAVMVVDRSLKERTPGTYETTVKLRRPGRYDIAFFLDSPKAAHCFPVEVLPDPKRARARELLKPSYRITSLLDQKTIPVGEPVDLRFQVSDRTSGAPLSGIPDLKVVTFLGPGQWQERLFAKHQGEGIYQASFTPPESGIYYVFLRAPSLGIELKDSKFLVLRAQTTELAQGK
ncbi:MAG: cytochrome D1 [Deltaproteobacteria bacterium]|nr:cytochrome D1 [Deltaproteobacteria bacterium]